MYVYTIYQIFIDFFPLIKSEYLDKEMNLMLNIYIGMHYVRDSVQQHEIYASVPSFRSETCSGIRTAFAVGFLSRTIWFVWLDFIHLNFNCLHSDHF